MDITDTTTTDTTTTDTTTAPILPTLAELLATRANQRAEDLAESERRRKASRELDRRAAMERIAEWARDHLSQDLAAALAVEVDCDEHALNQLEEDYPAELPGHLRLTITGEAWTIRQSWNRDAALKGPEGYRVVFTMLYRDEPLDAQILDAIAAYPAWLARADERRAAQEAKEHAEAEQREERRRRSAVRHFDFVTGLTPRDMRPGVLAAGTRLRVCVLDPRERETGGIMQWSGVLQAHDERWLLLNIEGHGAGVGAQRLIPLARVQEVLPLPDLTPEPASAAPVPTPAAPPSEGVDEEAATANAATANAAIAG